MFHTESIKLRKLLEIKLCVCSVVFNFSEELNTVKPVLRGRHLWSFKTGDL